MLEILHPAATERRAATARQLPAILVHGRRIIPEQLLSRRNHPDRHQLDAIAVEDETAIRIAGMVHEIVKAIVKATGRVEEKILPDPDIPIILGSEDHGKLLFLQTLPGEGEERFAATETSAGDDAETERRRGDEEIRHVLTPRSQY